MTRGDPRGVFFDIEADEGVAAALTERARLMAVVIQRVRGMARVEAAETLGVSHERIADLLAGRLSRFGLDELRAMRTALE